MLRSLQKIVRGRYAERHDERDEIGRRELAAESRVAARIYGCAGSSEGCCCGRRACCARRASAPTSSTRSGCRAKSSRPTCSRCRRSCRLTPCGGTGRRSEPAVGKGAAGACGPCIACKRASWCCPALASSIHTVLLGCSQDQSLTGTMPFVVQVDCMVLWQNAARQSTAGSESPQTCGQPHEYHARTRARIAYLSIEGTLNGNRPS